MAPAVLSVTIIYTILMDGSSSSIVELCNNRTIESTKESMPVILRPMTNLRNNFSQNYIWLIV